MKYAICNEVYQDWTFEQAFEHAASLGYQGLEIAPFTLAKDVGEISADQKRNTVRLAQENGLEIIGLHWLLAHTEGFHLTSPDDSVRNATADYLKSLAECCSELGGDLMVLGSPQQRNFGADTTIEQATIRAQQVLEQVVPTLEKTGVRIALEPLGPQEGNFLNTASEAVELIERIDSEWIQLHLDVKAMSSESISIPEIIKQNQEYTIHFHANDPNLKGPGMGNVDFEPIFCALKAAKYDGWVSVEVFDYGPGIESLTTDSIRYMREIEARLESNQNPTR